MTTKTSDCHDQTSHDNRLSFAICQSVAWVSCEGRSKTDRERHNIKRSFMHHFNSSAQLNENELGEIKACLNHIRSRLPVSTPLTPQQRRQMFKMGDKSVAFVKNCLLAAQNHRDMLAAGFDVSA